MERMGARSRHPTSADAGKTASAGSSEQLATHPSMAGAARARGNGNPVQSKAAPATSALLGGQAGAPKAELRCSSRMRRPRKTDYD